MTMAFKKIIKSLSILGLASASATPVFAITSCNKDSGSKPIDPDDPVPQPEPVPVTESIFEVDSSGKLTSFDESKISSSTNTISIPSTVKTIPEGFFKNKFTKDSNNLSNICYILIPSSVTTIGSKAFEGCNAITGLCLPNRTSIPNTWATDAFTGWNWIGYLYKSSGNYLTDTNLFEYFMYNSDIPNWIPDVSWKCERYISDRTFSLCGVGYYKINGTGTAQPYQSCNGTSWILKDATPNDSTDYQYYIGTNWHVKDGIDSLKQDFDYYGYHFTYDHVNTCYGDKSTQTNHGSQGIGLKWDTTNSDYTTFKSNECNWEDESNFVYGYDSGYWLCADFYVAKVDFNDVKESMPSTIKDKLDDINSWNSRFNCINYLADLNELTQGVSKYVGGFPVDQNTEDNLAKWETHLVDPEYCKYDTDDEYRGHFVDSDYEYIDYTKQYVYDTNMGLHWMDGGASGSMLITKNLEVCGIYWGGHTNDEQDEFYPQFSILNDSTYKDFISKYL